MRTEVPLASPQPILTRVRQAFGTRTWTGGESPRITSAALRQYRHGRRPVGTTWRRYAGGTETTPSTSRYPPLRCGNLESRMIVSHDTVDGGSAGAERAAEPVSAARARATMSDPIRMPHHVYTAKTPGVRGSAFSAGGVI